MSEQQWVTYQQRSNVGIIELNRPKANAYNLAYVQAFAAAVAAANQDKQVNAVIVKSASEKFFCAGADIKEFQENSTADNQRMVEQARLNMAAMENSKKIYIAQIAGHALGGGLEIAMACDLRFAAAGNYLFGLPEIKLGLMPGNGGTQRLVRLVGLSRALEILATGDNFNPEQAQQWGMVNQLCAAEDLNEYALSFAQKISAGPALALAATKQALREGIELPLAEGLVLEQKLADQLYDTKDADEGFKAFLEKREAAFVGE